MDDNNKVGRLKSVPKRKSKSKRSKAIPCDVLRFYIKLYCDKKPGVRNGKNSTVLIEAVNSWLLLSEHEKQQFKNKYKECCVKYYQKVVNCIHKAEPYMKKKNPQRISDQSVQDSDQNVIDLQIDNNEENLSQTVETLTEDPNTSKVENETEWDENINEDVDMEQFLTKSVEVQDDESNSQHEPLRILYQPEPMPPGLKTGKELFQMIMTMDKENESTWTSLSNREKHYYNQAVLTLKKDYLQKYRQYLESLPERELFDYYNKTLH